MPNRLRFDFQTDVEPPFAVSYKEDLPAVPTTSGEWPNEGKVEFVDYSASYRPGILPDVLRSVTFLVRPKEKVSHRGGV